MIGALQARLLQILRGDSSRVTIFAGRYLVGFRVVMAIGASMSHRGHLRMQFVRKNHRLVLILQFIQHADIGSDIRIKILGGSVS
jgi:hypothetical protein